jgi:tRNA dimethylallyltransferase
VKPLLVIIAGPTGVGKTNTAIQIAKKINTEIISADSRQIFKEMTIGTAVPSGRELNQVKHHFIQSHSIHENFNASQYEFEVIDCLNTLFQKHSCAILAGGSGLYIDAVCNGIDDLPTIPVAVREKYKNLFEEKGIEYLQDLVKQNDPDYYFRVDIQNPKRLLKALEVFEITGKPYSSLLTNQDKERSFRTIKIILDLPRNELYNRINNRVDKMISEGLVVEAQNLIQHKNLTPLKTVGYKELFDYFENKLSLEEAIVQIKNHSRAYARRQLTWFRRYKSAFWFTPSDTVSIVKLINSELNRNV